MSRPSSPSVDEAPAALSKPPTAPSVKMEKGRPRKKTRIPRQGKVHDQTVPTAPKPTVPKPTAPKPTAPKPTAPKPTAPKPTAPKPTAPKPTAPKPETQTESQDRYLLRRKQQPRYNCGTCGLRDCVCVLAVNENREVVHRINVRAESL